MAICKYFLEGRCRFGQNCKFEHPRNDNYIRPGVSFGGGGGGGDASNKYKWNTTSNQTDPSDLVDSLPREMSLWEASKMWPFSTLALERELESLPGFEDISAEELRCEAYAALKAGNIQPYVEKVKKITLDYQNKRQHLKQMTPSLKHQLITLLEELRKKKTYNTSKATSLPGNTSQGLFGKPTGSFSNQSQGQTSIFGQSNQTTSPFSQNSQSQSSAGLFGKSPTSSSSSGSVFGGNSAGGTPSLFGKKPENPSGSNPFAQASSTNSSSIFGGGSAPSTSSNPFANPASAPQPGLFGKPANTAPAPTPAPGLFSSGSSSNQPASQGLFGSSSASSPFASSTSSASSAGLFGGASSAAQALPSTGLFGQTTSQPATTNTSATSSGGLFGATTSNTSSSGTAATGLFGKPATSQTGLFGSQSATPSNTSNSALYTPLSDLTEAEKAEFMAKTFTLGRIPIRPPPREMIDV